MNMFNDITTLNNYLSNLRTGDYQRDNFDAFLKKVKFKFDLPAIHIAGTNGKGTTGQIINDIYVKAGYKVGYYRSPYFLTPLEVITINNINIELQEFEEMISPYYKEIKKYNLSSFEVETFAALSFFKKQQCQICIIECGMGGEVDATNIFIPILSIITSIGLEHTMFLGSSISEIAFQKAGILKDDVTCIIGDLNQEATDAIAYKAHETNSLLIKRQDYLNERLVDNGYYFDFKPYQNLFISSTGFYCLEDAAIALSAIEFLKKDYPYQEDNIKDALKEFHINGRMNILNSNPLLIADGAHNPEGIQLLRQSLEKLNKEDKPIHIIFAAFKDKNIDAMLAELSFISKDIVLTSFEHPRARKDNDYFLFLDEYQYQENPLSLISDKIKNYPDDIVVVCGSLAFAYYVVSNRRKLL